MTVSEQVLDFIKQYGMIPQGSSVTVGLSGGADSVCLLFLLSLYTQRLDFTLEAVHVEHGIRGEEALSDKAFCESLCERLGIKLRAVHVDVPKMAKEQGLTLEEAGRIARYRIFEETGSDRVAVAHHGSDQAETVLFNLIRGSAVAGLGGMRPVRGRIIRPLLCLTRPQIEGFLKEQGLKYCTDSTNSDNEIARNCIRNKIMPLAERINSRAIWHINQNAQYIRDVEDFLKSQAMIRADKYISGAENKVVLSLEGFREENNIIKDYIIRECLFRSAGRLKDITMRHVSSVRELSEKNSGKKVCLPYGIEVVRNFDRLEFSRALKADGEENAPGKNPEDETEEAGVAAPENGSVLLPDGSEYVFSFDNDIPPDKAREDHRYTKCFDYDKIKGRPCLRPRRKGDYISIRGGSKKIKQLFIEERIPVSDRDRIYMLCDGSEVMWVPGLRMGERYKVSEETNKIWKVERKENG